MAGDDCLGARFRHRTSGHRIVYDLDLGSEIGDDRDRNDGDQKQQQRVFGRRGAADGAKELPEDVFRHDTTPFPAGRNRQPRKTRRLAYEYSQECIYFWISGNHPQKQTPAFMKSRGRLNTAVLKDY